MAQYAVPNADITDGTWLDEASGAVNLYDGIVPGTPGSIGAGDDSTYIISVSAPSNAACAFGLSSIEDPVSSTGHVLRWRRAKNAAGGSQIDLTVQVRQGYVSEGTQGTLITTVSDTNLSDTIATSTHNLSSAAADLITNYASLDARIVANQV